MKEILLEAKGNTNFEHESGQRFYYSVKTDLRSHIAFQQRIGGPTTGWSIHIDPPPRTLADEYRFAAEILDKA